MLSNSCKTDIKTDNEQHREKQKTHSFAKGTKSKDYIKLSETNKDVPDLVEQLKNDKSFKKMYQLQNELSIEVLDKNMVNQNTDTAKSKCSTPKEKLVHQFAKDGIKKPESFGYKSMAVAVLMKGLLLKYPKLNSLSRVEQRIVLKAARPELDPELRFKRDSLLKLKLKESLSGNKLEY